MYVPRRRVVAMIRIDALWLAIDPVDPRAGDFHQPGPRKHLSHLLQKHFAAVL